MGSQGVAIAKAYEVAAAGVAQDVVHLCLDESVTVIPSDTESFYLWAMRRIYLASVNLLWAKN